MFDAGAIINGSVTIIAGIFTGAISIYIYSKKVSRDIARELAEQKVRQKALEKELYEYKNNNENKIRIESLIEDVTELKNQDKDSVKELQSLNNFIRDNLLKLTNTYVTNEYCNQVQSDFKEMINETKNDAKEMKNDIKEILKTIQELSLTRRNSD